MKFKLCQMMSRYFGLSLNSGVSSVLKKGVLPKRQNSFIFNKLFSNNYFSCFGVRGNFQGINVCT
jgi:hypothetical protein